MTYDELEREALKLPPREREALLMRVPSSLDSLEDFDPGQLDALVRRCAAQQDPSRAMVAAEVLAMLRAASGD